MDLGRLGLDKSGIALRLLMIPRSSGRTGLWLGFVLTTMVLIVNGVVAALSVRTPERNNLEALRTRGMMERLERLLEHVVAAESGQRGYLLTGVPEYLGPYHQSVLSIDAELNALDSRVEAEEQARFQSLREAIAEKLGELDRTIELYKNPQTRKSALEVVMTDRGRRLMGEVRRMILDLHARQQDRLELMTASSAGNLRMAMIALGVSTAIAAVTIYLLAVHLRRYMRERDGHLADQARQLERWRVTLASVGDGVIVTDAEGRVTFMNQVAEQLCKVSAAGSLGGPLADVFRIVNEETLAPVENPVLKVLEHGGTVGLANHTLLIRPDQSAIPIHDSAAPILGLPREIQGVVLVFRDDTDRRRAERELTDLSLRKDEFLAMLAHELRNPLASIQSALEVLNAASAETSASARRVISQRVAHIKSLLNDLLDVSRITRGKIQLQKRTIDARVAIEAAVEASRHEFDSRGQRLATKLPTAPLWVLADPIRLEQILMNLLFNAAKYTPERGEIEIRADLENDEAVFRVRDNGVGVSAEMLPRLFQLFSQGERTLARSEGGLGVGLAIVKSLVERHGGSVAARSPGTGRGSEFEVRLPAALPEEIGAPDPAPIDAQPSRGSRILVVDDNRDLARSLALLLELQGHSVRSVYDGPECIEAVKREGAEVILLDIGLPTLNGYQVARILRNELKRDDLLIIAISGYGQDEDRLRSREAGINHHLIKPVDIDTISKIIASSVGAHS